jgi:hypothetical protein
VQSCHWYAYELGLFDQVPFVVVSVCPCCPVPLIAGSDVFCGAADGDCTVGVVCVLVVAPELVVALGLVVGVEGVLKPGGLAPVRDRVPVTYAEIGQLRLLDPFFHLGGSAFRAVRAVWLLHVPDLRYRKLALPPTLCTAIQ